MGHGKIYHYEYLRTSSKKPYKSYTIWENANNSVIVMIDSTDSDYLIYSDDEGATWGNVGELTGNFYAAWHDMDNDILYIFTSMGIVESVDMTDPSAGLSEFSDPSAVIGDSRPFDVFMIGSNLYILCKDAQNHATDELCVYTADEDPVVYKCKLDVDDDNFEISMVVIIDDQAWFIVDNQDDDICKICRYDESLNTVIEMENCDAATSLPAWGTYNTPTVYDGIDKISFKLKYDGDGKFYLCSYSIGDDTFTKGEEFNVTMMAERNCGGDIFGDPYTEKAIHTSSYFVYRLSIGVSPTTLYKIADLNNCITPPTSALSAITDTFVFADDKLYKYIDYMMG